MQWFCSLSVIKQIEQLLYSLSICNCHSLSLSSQTQVPVKFCGAAVVNICSIIQQNYYFLQKL